MKQRTPRAIDSSKRGDDALRWRVLKSMYEIDSPFLKVKKEQVELPSGQIVEDFFSIEGTQVVAVLAVNRADNRVLLVKQYRHAVGQVTVDLPGGAVRNDEQPAIAARRELLEETGYKATGVRRLFSYYPDSGRKGDIKHVFLAENVQPSIPQPKSSAEEDANTEPVWIPLDRLMREIQSGRILEGTLVSAIGFYLSFKSRHLLLRPRAAAVRRSPPTRIKA